MTCVRQANVRIVSPLPQFLALILPQLLLQPASGITKKKAVSPAKKSQAKSTSKRSTAKSGVPKKSAAKSSRRRRASRRIAARNQGQRAPEPERIKQIQSALASRGYDVEPSGVWDQRSVSALAKFQDDNEIKNLTGKGKLDSLTLIALGLGPERGPQAEKPKNKPEGQQP
jgi:peptidoglycan hydrolase-like protein with peptidoglycan-binding domain